MGSRWLTVPLASLLLFSTLTISARGRWAAGLFEAGLALLGLAWIFWSLRWKREPGFEWPLRVLGLVVIWGLLQRLCGITAYSYATESATLYWCSLFLAAFLCRQAFQEDAGRKRFLNLLAASGTAFAVYALLQPYLGAYHLGGLAPVRVEDMVGPFQNRNTYASFIELALPVACWEGFRRRANAWLYWCAAAVMIASVIASGSRAGSLLVCGELVLIFLLAWGRGMAPAKRIARAGLQMAALGSAWVLLSGWEFLWVRLQQPDPLSGRREIFSSAISMILERPWTGFGLGTFSTAYPGYAAFDVGRLVNFAHNDWIQWAVEGGLPLWLGMVSVGLWCLRPAMRHVWGLGVLFVMLHALVDYPFQRAGMAAWVFAMIAALGGAERGSAPLSRNSEDAEAGLPQARAVGNTAAVQQHG